MCELDTSSGFSREGPIIRFIRPAVPTKQSLQHLLEQTHKAQEILWANRADLGIIPDGDLSAVLDALHRMYDSMPEDVD